MEATEWYNLLSSSAVYCAVPGGSNFLLKIDSILMSFKSFIGVTQLSAAGMLFILGHLPTKMFTNRKFASV